MDYTPTTEEVERATAGYDVFALSEGEFDRWLADHDREVAAQAWD